MKPTAKKRIGRLEVKSSRAMIALAEDQRERQAEARAQWRKENHERLRWEMFLSLYGPDGDWYGALTDTAEKIAEIAYRTAMRKALKHYSKDGIVDYSKLKGPDGAFVFAIELFYEGIGDADLLIDTLSRYGSNLPSSTPFDELAIRKIEEDGLDWLQISYSDEAQQAMEEQVFGTFISENFMK